MRVWGRKWHPKENSDRACAGEWSGNSPGKAGPDRDLYIKVRRSPMRQCQNALAPGGRRNWFQRYAFPYGRSRGKKCFHWKWWGGRILLPAGPLPWTVCVTLLRTVFRDRSHEMCEAGWQIRELLRKLPRELLLVWQGILDSAGRARPGEALLGGRETEGATAVLRRLMCCAYDGLRGFQRCG